MDLLVLILVLNTELIKARDHAEAAAENKTQFLSTMSHEIRTPMNAVIGLSHLLMQDDPKSEQIDNLKTLKFASQNLLSLINDVLDINKIDAGKIRFEKIDFNLDTLVAGLEHSFAIAANKKNIQLNINKQANVPTNLIGDPTRLTQVLTNLIGNAIKFTINSNLKSAIPVLVSLPTNSRPSLNPSDKPVSKPPENLVVQDSDLALVKN